LKIGWAIIGAASLLAWVGLMSAPVARGNGYMATGFYVLIDSHPAYAERFAAFKLVLAIATSVLLSLSAFSIFKMTRAK